MIAAMVGPEKHSDSLGLATADVPERSRPANYHTILGAPLLPCVWAVDPVGVCCLLAGSGAHKNCWLEQTTLFVSATARSYRPAKEAN